MTTQWMLTPLPTRFMRSNPHALGVYTRAHLSHPAAPAGPRLVALPEFCGSYLFAHTWLFLQAHSFRHRFSLCTFLSTTRSKLKATVNDHLVQVFPTVHTGDPRILAKETQRERLGRGPHKSFPVRIRDLDLRCLILESLRRMRLQTERTQRRNTQQRNSSPPPPASGSNHLRKSTSRKNTSERNESILRTVRKP